MVAVFVTGANGFIAAETVKQLIESGYDVVGSVRTAAKGEKLSKVFPKHFSYEIVPDLTETSFDEAVKKHPEVTVFIHAASPVNHDAEDVEKGVILPAIEGTRGALLSVQKFGPQIKKVVVTSSFVTVQSRAGQLDKSVTITEETRNPISYEDSLAKGTSQANRNSVGYWGSKWFAELAVWDFVKDEKPHFTLTTVHPLFVFGPQADDGDAKGVLNFSAEIINKVLAAKTQDDISQDATYFVDVRDVAKAHIRAFENDEAAGKRLLLATGTFSWQRALDIVHKTFPEQSKGSAIGTPGTGEEREAKLAPIDDSFTRKILGFDATGLEKCVIDTVAQIYSAREALGK